MHNIDNHYYCLSSMDKDILYMSRKLTYLQAYSLKTT